MELGPEVTVKVSGAVTVGANSFVFGENGMLIGWHPRVDAATESFIVLGFNDHVKQANAMALSGDQEAGTPMSVDIGKSSPNQHASLDLGDNNKGHLLNCPTTSDHTALVVW